MITSRVQIRPTARREFLGDPRFSKFRPGFQVIGVNLVCVLEPIEQTLIGHMPSV